MNSVEKERWYSCVSCGATFMSESELDVHIELNHTVTIKSISEMPQYSPLKRELIKVLAGLRAVHLDPSGYADEIEDMLIARGLVGNKQKLYVVDKVEELRDKMMDAGAYGEKRIIMPTKNFTKRIKVGEILGIELWVDPRIENDSWYMETK